MATYWLMLFIDTVNKNQTKSIRIFFNMVIIFKDKRNFIVWYLQLIFIYKSVSQLVKLYMSNSYNITAIICKLQDAKVRNVPRIWKLLLYLLDV